MECETLRAECAHLKCPRAGLTGAHIASYRECPLHPNNRGKTSKPAGAIRPPWAPTTEVLLDKFYAKAVSVGYPNDPASKFKTVSGPKSSEVLKSDEFIVLQMISFIEDLDWQSLNRESTFNAVSAQHAVFILTEKYGLFCHG